MKCDEGRPVCGQCSRLGHTCDYLPRLAFRDDTQRVVDRMQLVNTVGSSVWDLRVASPAPSSAGSTIDDLAPFATLLTDEDRERKAEASPPGTFTVIVNPDSFQHLAEYASDDSEQKTTDNAPPRREHMAASLASNMGRDSGPEAISVPGDPNTVIIPKFEDLSRRTTRELKSPISPTDSNMPSIKREDSEPLQRTCSQEASILRHFRDTVWKQLAPPEHKPDSSIVLLNEAAAQFPALSRAMMAVGSLALFQHGGKERLDSLQHYSQTLPELQSSLKSEEDLASDGAFLTHFLMLLYEIATADEEPPHIWRHHISTLLKITLLRQRIFGGERFPFIVWWICGIDLDAVLSGKGAGEFVGYMLKNDLIPPPSFHLYPLGADSSSVVYPEERETLPLVLQLDYEVVLHAIRLGLLAAEFRSDPFLDGADSRQKAMAIRMRQSRIADIQEGLRHLWTVPTIQDLGQMQLPTRAQRLFHHAWTLYRSCLIYSHTSMWPGQRIDTSPDYDVEIDAAAQQITQVAEVITTNDPTNSRYLVFPLFMAGFASTDGRQKLLALDLIQQLEPGCIGQSVRTARRALEAVYGRQQQRFMLTGQSLDVDWMEVMTENGLTMVNFGL